MMYSDGDEDDEEWTDLYYQAKEGSRAKAVGPKGGTKHSTSWRATQQLSAAKSKRDEQRRAQRAVATSKLDEAKATAKAS